MIDSSSKLTQIPSLVEVLEACPVGKMPDGNSEEELAYLKLVAMEWRAKWKGHATLTRMRPYLAFGVLSFVNWLTL